MGKIVAINISEKKGVQKKEVATATLKTDHGIIGDAHAANWHRQVSLLDINSVNKMLAVRNDIELPPGAFAENILTEEMDLVNLAIGTKLRLGPTAIGEVTQIGKECHHHCQIYQKVGDCVMPREGIFIAIKVDGDIKAGDEIQVVENV